MGSVVDMQMQQEQHLIPEEGSVKDDGSKMMYDAVQMASPC